MARKLLFLVFTNGRLTPSPARDPVDDFAFPPTVVNVTHDPTGVSTRLDFQTERDS